MTDARVTQVAVEEWATNSPDAQVTQIAVEEWVSSVTVTGYAMVTQVAVEEWVAVDVVSTGRKRRYAFAAT